ncbi:MAG: EAL domain-containing protein [Aquabacterium sp.]
MNASRIVALFLAFGIAWIWVSDRAIDLVVADPHIATWIQSIKGMVFVGLSTVLIYVLVRHAERTQLALKAEAVREKDRLAQILDVTPAIIYSLKASPDGQPSMQADFVSHNVEAFTGHPMSRWLNEPQFWIHHVHPDDRAAVEKANAELYDTGGVSHEYRFQHADGSYRWIRDHLILLRDVDGRPAQILGAWMDVTERREAEEQLQLVAGVFEASQEGISITDAGGRFVSVNQSFTRITGYTQEDVQGKTPAILKSGHQDRAFYEEMWQRLATEGRWEGEIWNRRKSGEVYPEWLTISAIEDAQGQVRHYLGIFTETSSHKAAEERIERLVNYDQLTNLPNRALLQDRAKVALASASRTHVPVAVMQLNIDHFRNINETLGPEAGDQTLVTVAQRLLTVLRPEDTVSRLGADEFIVLLPHTPVQDVPAIALRLMGAVNDPFTVAGQEMRLTASIGIAEFPENGADLARLIQSAGSAMHQAKRDGRNTFRFFSHSLQEQVKESLLIERDLRHAVERRQLVLHYQPQMDVHQKRIVGVEALVRWQHPEWGLVPPGKFIPIAEECGLIRQIGHWVMQTAVAQNQRWREEGLPIVPVAINLSPAEFKDPQLRDAIIEVLRDSKLPTNMVELELTESVAMEDTNFTIATIEELKRLGVMLSIDDFGTGYSSLSSLKRFAVDKLKIDQSFVRGLNFDRQDEAIVKTMISLAQSLGLETIAEGVETAEQLAFLQANGCETAQGYLFSKPVPAEQFAALLRQPVWPFTTET